MLKIDVDVWKNFLLEDGVNLDVVIGGGFVLNVVMLKMVQLYLMGCDYNQVEISLWLCDNGWQIGLNICEVVGDIFWCSVGEGWVEGNFKCLVICLVVEVSEGSISLFNLFFGMSFVVDDF